MRLELQREPTAGGATYGVMTVEGGPTLQTLEPPIREVKGQPVEQWKVKGNTAIPEGDYAIVRLPSPHFKMRVLPHLVDVPGFDHVMIHPLNTVRQTEACIGVGTHRGRWDVPEGQIPVILHSEVALCPLDSRIAGALARGESVTISIRNPKEDANGTV